MAKKRDPFEIGGIQIAAGSQNTVRLPVARLYNDTPVDLQVEVFHGNKPGPVLLICAAIHGDELNGIEICRRLQGRINPKALHGTVLMVPVVNVFGFIQKSRYLPDRRDLNRCFPGSDKGALTSRLAHLVTRELISRATHILDLHTGAIHRDNLPQIRCDTENETMMAMARAFGAPLIMHNEAKSSSLRGYAAKAGVPCILYEAGEALRFSDAAIRTGLKGAVNLLRHLGMQKGRLTRGTSDVASIRSYWIRSEADGLVLQKVKLGQRVNKGNILAYLASPHSQDTLPIRAPSDGIVIGITNIPVTNEGEGLYHIAQYAGDEIETVNEQLDEFLMEYA